MLDDASDSLVLSARAYHRVVKVARTIADLARDDRIQTVHMAEALRYRPQLSRTPIGPLVPAGDAAIDPNVFGAGTNSQSDAQPKKNRRAHSQR